MRKATLVALIALSTSCGPATPDSGQEQAQARASATPLPMLARVRERVLASHQYPTAVSILEIVVQDSATFHELQDVLTPQQVAALTAAVTALAQRPLTHPDFPDPWEIQRLVALADSIAASNGHPRALAYHYLRAFLTTPTSRPAPNAPATPLNLSPERLRTEMERADSIYQYLAGKLDSLPRDSLAAVADVRILTRADAHDDNALTPEGAGWAAVRSELLRIGITEETIPD